jgi:hypothetical protein
MNPLSKIFNAFNWLPYYFQREFSLLVKRQRPEHLFFCICDHFEPYWQNATEKIAQQRLGTWINEYPKIAGKYKDTEGQTLKYSFFYPEEEYKKHDLDILAEFCHAGWGEVEVHLHHHNDTSVNLRQTLLDYKKRLHEVHGLLPVNKETSEISYGFIHGNWALDNSRPDGKWCGVNDEITILQETGCYADFTMPSAPSDTQTRKVNSIYYAIDDPHKPKSHDWGEDAAVGKKTDGLLMIQGPLGLRCNGNMLQWKIENGGLQANNPPSKRRVDHWFNRNIRITGFEKGVFVRLYTHGAQEAIMEMLFNKNGFNQLFSSLEEIAEERDLSLHYLSSREMANIVFAAEDRHRPYSPQWRDHLLLLGAVS